MSTEKSGEESAPDFLDVRQVKTGPVTPVNIHNPLLADVVTGRIINATEVEGKTNRWKLGGLGGGLTGSVALGDCNEVIRARQINFCKPYARIIGTAQPVDLIQVVCLIQAVPLSQRMHGIPEAGHDSPQIPPQRTGPLNYMYASTG